jgi:hypothetical protein
MTIIHNTPYSHNNDRPIEVVLARLDRSGLKRSGRGWVARCLAHDDRHASLSVTEADDGKVLLHCHAGCTTEDVLKAHGLTFRDLFPQDDRGRPAPSGRPPHRPAQEARPAPEAPSWPRREYALEVDRWAQTARQTGLWAREGRRLNVREEALAALRVGDRKMSGVSFWPEWGQVLVDAGDRDRLEWLQVNFVRRIHKPGEPDLKLSQPGAFRGLYLPTCWELRAGRSGRLYVVEGGSDTAAVWGMGLAVVGLPNCRDGEELLCRALCDAMLGGLLPDSLEVVLVADNDEAGRRGFAQVGQYVADNFKGEVVVYLSRTPDDAKDSREWLRSRSKRVNDEPTARLAAWGRWFAKAVMALAVRVAYRDCGRISDSHAHARAYAHVQAQAQAVQAQAHTHARANPPDPNVGLTGILPRGLIATREELDRPCPNGHTRALESRADPDHWAALRLRDKRWSCPVCSLRLKEERAEHFGLIFHGLTQCVYSYECPREEFGAVQDRIGRLRKEGHDGEYVKVEQAGGRVVVLTTAPVAGGEPMAPLAGFAVLLDAIAAIPLNDPAWAELGARGPHRVTASKAWQLHREEREGKWYDGGVMDTTIEQLVSDLKGEGLRHERKRRTRAYEGRVDWWFPHDMPQEERERCLDRLARRVLPLQRERAAAPAGKPEDGEEAAPGSQQQMLPFDREQRA